jgi:hypothetical protein
VTPDTRVVILPSSFLQPLPGAQEEDGVAGRRLAEPLLNLSQAGDPIHIPEPSLIRTQSPKMLDRVTTYQGYYYPKPLLQRPRQRATVGEGIEAKTIGHQK